MADDSTTNARANQQPPEPAPDLRSLGDRLAGTWKMSGDVRGTVTYEWLEGGFFLVQRVDLGQQDGERITGIEVIGHLKPFGEAPSEEIRSRFYSNTGDTLDYVYELEGNTLTIWAGERGSLAYYEGKFGEDGNTLTGAWHYPGGGGYEATSTRSGGRTPRYDHAQSGADRNHHMKGRHTVDMKLELVPLPVADVDRAKAFYAEQVGFDVDLDHRAGDEFRVVQLTPPGSACSIAIGTGIIDTPPGSVQGLHLVVPDIEAARADLAGRGVDVGEVQDLGGILYAPFSDPDGNGWTLQQLPY